MAKSGFALIPDVISGRSISNLISVIEWSELARSTRGGDVYGARNILEVPAISALAASQPISSLVEDMAGSGYHAVRGIFFDKTPNANWPVAWHQDLTLAVAEQRDIPGWGKWSIKAGVHHVQPPAEFFSRMITLRLHLDACGDDNGPLKVLPGSHLLGRIAAAQIPLLRQSIDEHICIATAGSVLTMKPLLLHASSAARTPHHRRVIHLEFAPEDSLPAGLHWLPLRETLGANVTSAACR